MKLSDKKISEYESVEYYLRQSIYTHDGLAILISCALSVCFLIDICFGFNFFPFGRRDDLGGTVVILITSPFLTFLMMVMMRQFSSSSRPIWAKLRFLLSIGFYFYLNF